MASKSKPFGYALEIGDVIDGRYVVKEKDRPVSPTGRYQYTLFNRHTGRLLMLTWAKIRQMFVGRDNEYEKTSQV